MYVSDPVVLVNREMAVGDTQAACLADS